MDLLEKEIALLDDTRGFNCGWNTTGIDGFEAADGGDGRDLEIERDFGAVSVLFFSKW